MNFAIDRINMGTWVPVKASSVEREFSADPRLARVRVSNDGAKIDIPPQVVERAVRYYWKNRHKDDHGAVWYRVLIALGAKIPWEGPPSLQPRNPFTTAEAAEGAVRWFGWRPFHHELRRIDKFKKFHGYKES